MPVAYWNPNWKVGFDKIDSQHQRLLELFNMLHEAKADELNSQQTVEKILTELIDYSVYHFSLEEYLFEKYKYPEAKFHINEHRFFSKKVEELTSDFSSGKAGVLDAAIDFLKDWLIDHIIREDKKYIPFLRQHGVTDAP